MNSIVKINGYTDTDASSNICAAARRPWPTIGYALCAPIAARMMTTDSVVRVA